MKNKILTSSILAIALLGSTYAFSVTKTLSQIVKDVKIETGDANELGIGAFSNLNSFDNDGFNHGVKKSYLKYVKEFGTGENNNHTPLKNDQDALKYFSKHSLTSQYSDDGHEYVEMFNNFYFESSIAISAGFQIANAFNGMDGAFDGVFKKANGIDTSLANSNKAAIVLLDDSSLSKKYDNASSISFAAEGAGYLAAIGAAVYTQYDVIKNKKENANIVMWGGMPFPTVYDFMSGFAQGITLFNKKYKSQDWYKKIVLWNGGLKQGDEISDTAVYGDAANEKDANAWYTKGFSATTGVSDGDMAKVKTRNAIKAKASVVFPIAGGNTSIAEAEIAKNLNTSTRMMGIDADSSLSAKEPKLYLGTAEKNLEMGGYLGLWAMDDADDDGKRNFIDNDAISEAPKEYASWLLAGNTPGAQLHGDINNGGVEFNYVNRGIILEDENQSNGYSKDLVDAWMFFADKINKQDDIEGFENFLNLAKLEVKNTGIEFADTQFITADANTNQTHSNLTWLWITLGFILGLCVIWLIIWLVVRKKKNF